MNLEENFKHWKDLDRYENDFIFKRVVDLFEEHVNQPLPLSEEEVKKEEIYKRVVHRAVYDLPINCNWDKLKEDISTLTDEFKSDPKKYTQAKHVFGFINYMIGFKDEMEGFKLELLNKKQDGTH